MGTETKNQAARKRRRLELETPLEPVHILTPDEDVEPERELVFTLDEVEYTILKDVPASFSVAYLNNVRKRGTEFAMAEAMVALLGEDAMDALADCPQMTPENLRQIMKIVERKMLAAQEEALGN